MAVWVCLISTGVKLTTTIVILSQYDVKLAAICLISVPSDYFFSQWYSKFLKQYALEVFSSSLFHR